MPCESTFHKYVYRRLEQLDAGTAYHFQTRNLRDVYIFQGRPADPVMYIVNESNDIVAYNDDYSGLASEIFFTPSVTSTYTLIIRAYATDRPGYCELYRGINGAAPELVERDVLFFGVTSPRRWNQGDVIQTTNSTGDPYLFVHWGNKLYWNDDGGAGLNSKFVATAAGYGQVTVGSYTRSTEGSCDLCVESDSGLLPASEQAATSAGIEAQQLITELQESKEGLEKLQPLERDKAVLEMQQRILPEDQLAPAKQSPSMEELKRLMVG